MKVGVVNRMLNLVVVGTFDWTKSLNNSILSDNVTGSFRFSAKSVSFVIICSPCLMFIVDSLAFALRFATSSLNIFQIDLESDRPSSILDCYVFFLAISICFETLLRGCL